jgi:hypothetical protein
MPAIKSSRKIHSIGLRPRDFFGFIEEEGLVAVV